MRLTIFARSIIGYLVIFIPATGVSVYAFTQLTHYREVTDHILQVDNRMRNLVQMIADSILVLARNERKYVITKDREFVNQYMLFEADVDARIGEAVMVANGDKHTKLFMQVKSAYEYYKYLFHEELSMMSKGQPYPFDAYKAEKDSAIDEMLMDLRAVKQFIEKDADEKIRGLARAVAQANRIAVAMAVGFILWSMVTAIIITRSITMPLTRMRSKTRQIAQGNFECGLHLSSPPKIGELASDFNLMCDKLKATDKMKSDFFALMAHELRTPLASIKEGTNLLLHHGLTDFKDQSEVLRIIAEEKQLSDGSGQFPFGPLQNGGGHARAVSGEIGYRLSHRPGSRGSGAAGDDQECGHDPADRAGFAMAPGG